MSGYTGMFIGGFRFMTNPPASEVRANMIATKAAEKVIAAGHKNLGASWGSTHSWHRSDHIVSGHVVSIPYMPESEVS